MLIQLTTLRHLFLSHPIFPPVSPLRFSFVTAFANRNPRSFVPNPRRSISSSGSVDRKSEIMEDEKLGFNKRRAEGKDKSDGSRKVLPLKQRKLNPNTICYLQIMGTGMDTQDTSPAVLLFFDKQRFIFNAGEGLQRYCTEHRIKLSKIDHIFLSRVCSETAGGLPGLLLTLAGMGDEGMSVNVWGPSDIKYLIDAMRSFIPKAAMVHTHSFGASPHSDGVSLSKPTKFCEPIVLIDDEVVKISAILLQPNTYEAKSPSGLEGDVGDKRDHNLKSFLQPCQVVLKPGDISVVYVCELPEIKGTFHPKKAAALGLRPGPKYRELQLGNPVKSDHQDIMVHPCDVMDPSVPGPIVFIVDCPTLSHLQELSSLESLIIYYGDVSNTLAGETSKAVSCIIHLSPSSVVNAPGYQKWMERFSGARHVMAGHEMKNVEIPVLKASARIAARLNYLCPRFFPASGFWSIPHLNGSTPGFQMPSESDTKLCEKISAENLLKFQLRPYAQLGIDRSGVPILTSKSEIIDGLLSEIPEIVDAAKQVNKFWNEGECIKEDTTSLLNKDIMIEEPWLNDNVLPSCLKNISKEDMEIVLLGTGSSQPSKYRNVSSIFINLFSKGSLILDCGEGTLGQLKRRFGIEGADDAVRGLRCIWISHIHADHHTGLARILALRRNLLKEVPHDPLLVIGPRQLKRYLDAYQLLEDLDMEFLDCKHTTESSLKNFESINSHSGESLSFQEKIQDIDSTLFAKGVRMQSCWDSPAANNSVVIPLIKKLKNVLKDAGLEALVSFPVVHCPNAYGVLIKAADRINVVGENIPGWKAVYSGDSRPCPELIKASQGATVLIHEATFEDGLVDEAIARNHSTTQEAIDVGNSAGVYRIILTHFSQRYPKIPVFDETHMHKTCIAFDLMSVNLADLPVLPKVLPYLRILFKNEIVDEIDDVDVLTAASEIG